MADKNILITQTIAKPADKNNGMNSGTENIWKLPKTQAKKSTKDKINQAKVRINGLYWM